MTKSEALDALARLTTEVAAYDREASSVFNRVVERCAQVADAFAARYNVMPSNKAMHQKEAAKQIALAVRALKVEEEK